MTKLMSLNQHLLVLILSLLMIVVPAAALASGDDEDHGGYNDDEDEVLNIPKVRFHGYNKKNNANASNKTIIDKTNYHKLKIHAIYNIEDNRDGPVGPNGLVTQRLENAVGNGMALDDDGKLFIPTTDGRIHIIDLTQTTCCNPDGSNIPVIHDVLDLAGDSRYTGVDPFDGDDIFVNRMHPTLTGNKIFAGNYDSFALLPRPEVLGVPNPPDYQFKSDGAVLFAINKNTGKLIWKSVIDDNPHTDIITNPTVHKGIIYVGIGSNVSGNLGLPGTLGQIVGTPGFLYGTDIDPNTPGLEDPYLPPGTPQEKTAMLYRGGIAAVDKKTGEVLWKTYNMPKTDYISVEEALAAQDYHSWAGGTLWGGGNFPIDKERNQLYYGSGQAFLTPEAPNTCETNRLKAVFDPNGDPRDIIGDGHCLDAGNPYGDFSNLTTVVEKQAYPRINAPSHALPSSVVAVDLDTGEIKWARRLQGYDVWNLSCLQQVNLSFFPGGFLFGNSNPLCPSYLRNESNTGEAQPWVVALQLGVKDLDTAENPMFVKNVKINGVKKDLVIVTTKAADVYALDADDGSTIWESKTVFGPGSLFGGGILWGSAMDRQRVYVHSTTTALVRGDVYDEQGNERPNPPSKVVSGSCPDFAFQIQDPEAGPQQTDPNPGGVWGALDVKTGDVVWQRCLVGQSVDSRTGSPTLGQPVAFNPDTGENDELGPVVGLSEGPIAVANGVLLIHGPTTSYAGADFQIQGPYTFQEYVMLDAATGEELRRLPMSLPDEPSAFLSKYQRPIIAADKVVLANGSRDRQGNGNPYPNPGFDCVLFSDVSSAPPDVVANNPICQDNDTLARRVVIYSIQEEDDDDDDHHHDLPWWKILLIILFNLKYHIG